VLSGYLLHHYFDLHLFCLVSPHATTEQQQGSWKFIGVGEDEVIDWQHEQEDKIRGAANQVLVVCLADAATIGSGHQQ